MISIKLLGNFIEIPPRRGCSPVNLLHIFRTLFCKNTTGGMLLNVLSFLPVYAIWVWIIPGKHFYTDFFIDFIILLSILPLYGKCKESFFISCLFIWWIVVIRFAVVGIVPPDVGGCVVWFHERFCLWSEWVLISWKTFLKWFNSFSKYWSIEQILYAQAQDL